eukprot:2646238-Prymnesium_polylepis.2
MIWSRPAATIWWNVERGAASGPGELDNLGIDYDSSINHTIELRITRLGDAVVPFNIPTHNVSSLKHSKRTLTEMDDYVEYRKQQKMKRRRNREVANIQIQHTNPVYQWTDDNKWAIIGTITTFFEPIRHIPGVGGVVGGIVDAGSNAITAPIRGVGHLADGNVGGALGVVMNPIAPPPPPSLPSPPPKQVPAGWENAQSFCNLSTTNHGNKDAYDCSAICNSKGKVWAQVHNNTCKCGDADQCFFTRKSEPSSETKMLLVNTPKFQHWLSIQHADIVKKINAIKRPYSNQK